MLIGAFAFYVLRKIDRRNTAAVTHNIIDVKRGNIGPCNPIQRHSTYKVVEFLCI